MHSVTYEELKPDGDDLLVFVDDTGHETFAGNQGFYGLGGCAVLGASYGHLKAKWDEVRAIATGDRCTPIHASTIERTRGNFAALSEFFLDRSFVRIAVTTTKKVQLPQHMHPCVPIMGQLREEIATVASVLPCKRVWIIIEKFRARRPDCAVLFLPTYFVERASVASGRALSNAEERKRAGTRSG